MSLTTELLQILNNGDFEDKRARIVETAFKNGDIVIQNKEAILLKWSLDHFTHGDQEMETLLYRLLKSDHFKELNRNDINTEDIQTIIEAIINKMQMFSESGIHITEPISISLVQICENRVFEQYFFHNIDIYCSFISKVFDRIAEKEGFLKCLCKQNLFNKNLVVQDKFYKHLVNTILPVFVNKLIDFEENSTIFEQISKILQKCLFNKNHNTFFEETSSGVSKTVIKYLNFAYKLETQKARLSFKIIFHSYSNSCNNFEWTYKFFIILIETLGFELPEEILVKKVKITADTLLSKSLEILLDLFEVISQKNVPDLKVKNLSFADFLQNILKSVIFLNASCSLVYNIFHKVITINPLVIEPVLNEIVVFTMLANNKSYLKEYENFIIAIFQVFSKLHRVEKLVSKILRSIQSSLQGDQEFEEVYPFLGINDLQNAKQSDICVKNMFSEPILQCFTKCICDLASSQVITLFRTLLFHLKEAIEDFQNLKEKNGKAPNNLVFLEILGTLLCCFLRSVRISEHTVAQNAVNKFIICLEELKDILQSFAASLLQKEHNNTTVEVFLNMSYYWAEINMTLAYYSLNNEVELKRKTDSNYSACNLTYLHSYLNVEQWCSIAERISNFGNEPCKNMLQKLYIQKIRSMLVFEKSFSEDIVMNVLKDIQSNIEYSWKEFLSNKFCVNHLLPKSDTTFVIYLAENLITEPTISEEHHLKKSCTITKAVNYVVLSKISKLFKQKRKLDESISTTKPLSSKLFSIYTEELFISEGSPDSIEKSVCKVKELFHTNREGLIEFKVNEEKLKSYLTVLQKFPIIFTSKSVQKLVLIYLFALHQDINVSNGPVKPELENLIIGILQSCRFNLLEIFGEEPCIYYIITHCEKYDVIFSHLIENAFRYEGSMNSFEFCINCLVNNLDDQKFMNCGLVVIGAINKLKRSKMSATVRNIAVQYRDKLHHKMFKILNRKEPELNLLKPYAMILKHNLSVTEGEPLQKLLNKLEKYCQIIFEEPTTSPNSCLSLFTILLNNKQKIKIIDNDFILKVWNKCKKLDDIVEFEEYSQLISLVFILVSNEEFQRILLDFLALTEQNVTVSNFNNLNKHLKVWGTMMTCNVNQFKMKIWQDVLEVLLFKLLDLVKDPNNVEGDNLVKNIVNLEEHIIQTQQFILTPALIDMFLMTPTILFAKKHEEHFHVNFSLSIALLEKLLKHRTGLIMDRLPPFLQQYRLILSELVKNSNSELNLEIIEINKVSDAAHSLEKLTKNLVTNKKDMGRIAMYLIADILEKYEQITLYPNVKIHLNNCIYSLISLCDHHAVAYLMRVLSTASTEMFKMLYDNYKKYYMFTGKV